MCNNGKITHKKDRKTKNLKELKTLISLELAHKRQCTPARSVDDPLNAGPSG
jgi:hypothetical protein